MDGISPTLALAVLLFGLSDGARDPAAEAALDDRSGCPVLAITGDPVPTAPSESWTNAFLDIGAAAPLLPTVIEPKWADHGIEGLEIVGDHALASPIGGVDPIVRRTITVGASGVAADSHRDPCATAP